MAFIVLVRGALAMSVAIKRHIPKGGVAKPMMIFKMKITPKCTGFTPNAVAIGANTGAQISKMALLSMTHPMIKRNRFTNNRNTALLEVTLIKKAEIAWGT